MVRIHPDPPANADPRSRRGNRDYGAIAQLGERLLCKQEVTGSIPVGSTSTVLREESATRRARTPGWCFFEVPSGTESNTDRLLFNNLG